MEIGSQNKVELPPQIGNRVADFLSPTGKELMSQRTNKVTVISSRTDTKEYFSL